MTDYPGGGSSDPLLEPIEGFEKDLESATGDVYRALFNAVAGKTGTDVTQNIADALARIDSVRARLQDYADNDIVPVYGALPAASPEANIPASPNEDGWNLVTFDSAIEDDEDYAFRVSYATLAECWRYVEGTMLEAIGAIYWDGELFHIYIRDDSP